MGFSKFTPLLAKTARVFLLLDIRKALSLYNNARALSFLLRLLRNVLREDDDAKETNP